MESLRGYGGYSPSGTVASKQKIAGHTVGQMQQYTPEQMQLFQNSFSNVGPDSYTSRLARGDESLFNEMEEPALRQFSGLQGGLASRFSGMGMGARKSSGFQNASNQQASDFASDLQSRRQELQRNAVRDLSSMSGDLLNQRPYENFLIEPNKKKSFLDQLMEYGLPLAGTAAGFFTGGPAGAMAGNAAGQAGANAWSSGRSGY